MFFDPDVENSIFPHALPTTAGVPSKKSSCTYRKLSKIFPNVEKIRPAAHRTAAGPCPAGLRRLSRPPQRHLPNGHFSPGPPEAAIRMASGKSPVSSKCSILQLMRRKRIRRKKERPPRSGQRPNAPFGPVPVTTKGDRRRQGDEGPLLPQKHRGRT